MPDIISTLDAPHLEFAFAITLRFERVHVIDNAPDGGRRTAVYVDEGVIEGPLLNGRAVPNSGGDYAYFRPDDTAVFDARYMLEADDGTPILIRNKGYLWGREADTMERLRHWAFEGGEPVPNSEYYLRARPTFECPRGPHYWLTRHVFVGVGERRADGNHVRYYKLT